MEADIQTLLDTFGDLRKEANVKACFGDPVTIEGRTVIPVARVGYGFGMGAGQGPMPESEEGMEALEEASAGGSGGGGGMTSSPLGVVEVTSQGVRVEPIIDEQRIAVLGLLVVAWSVFWLARAMTAIFGRSN
jgi:uncharacterized spore protein YtfJ